MLLTFRLRLHFRSAALRDESQSPALRGPRRSLPDWQRRLSELNHLAKDGLSSLASRVRSAHQFIRLTKKPVRRTKLMPLDPYVIRVWSKFYFLEECPYTILLDLLPLWPNQTNHFRLQPALEGFLNTLCHLHAR